MMQKCLRLILPVIVHQLGITGTCSKNQFDVTFTMTEYEEDSQTLHFIHYGDEYHFVLICKANNLPHLRQEYISKYNMTYPSMVKFIQLLNSNHVKTVQNVAIYICNGLMMYQT